MVNPSDTEEVGKRLELLRLALKFKTKGAFAAELNILPSSLTSYLNGSTRVPFDVTHILRIKHSVDPNWVQYGDRGGMPPKLLGELDRLLNASRSHSKPR